MKYVTGFRVFQAIVLIVIVSACVLGFFVVGPPSQERARRMDAQRVSDIQQISYAMDQFYNQTNFQRLPATLTELRSTQNIYVNSIRDPKTTSLYGFHSVDSLAYELCATFETTMDYSNISVSPSQNTFWNHQLGEKCYALKVNVMPQPTIAKPI